MVGWVGFQEGWRTYDAGFVRFELPRGMNCGPFKDGVLCRGEFAPDSPATIMALRLQPARAGRSREERQVEEGLAYDYLERIDTLVEGGISVIVRTIAAHGHDAIVDRIFRSIELVE